MGSWSKQLLHIRAHVRCDWRSRPRRSRRWWAPAGECVAAAAQVMGDALTDGGDRPVGEHDQAEVVHCDPGVGSAARMAVA